MIADPEGRGFFIVKVDKIIPGNALAPAGADRPDAERAAAGGCRTIMRSEFLAAMREEMKAKRNESAIQALKTRIVGSGG